MRNNFDFTLFENVVCQTVSILYRPQYSNAMLLSDAIWRQLGQY